MAGYIYLRDHTSYENSYKLGKAINLPDRDSQYITGELKRGRFIKAFYVNDMHNAEILLKNKFRNYHVYHDGGTEFYEKIIIDLIYDTLIDLNIEVEELDEDEIAELCHTKRITIIPTESICLTPRPDQKIIIDETAEYLAKNDKVILSLICGVGKTLISLWTAEKLQAKSIIIGVPNKLLLNQWEKNIKIVFKNVSLLIINGGITETDIKNFMKEKISSDTVRVIITTYHSAQKTLNNVANFQFDIQINDEAHHLTGKNTGTFVQILNINSRKQISLTATLKNVYGEDVISNNDIEKFGEILINRCLLWAIQNKIVCNYVIQTIIVNVEQIEEYGENKHLYLAAFAALKSLAQGSHHLLIYANSIIKAKQIIKYIELIAPNFNLPDLYFNTYDGSITRTKRTEIIKNFTNAKKGVLTCVYCLGEGWDLPLLDGVVFAENMSSVIRIVQSALRAGRIDKNDPEKKNKIILPIVNCDFSDEQQPEFKKVKTVINEMGMEDEKIMEKCKIYRTSITDYSDKPYNYESDDVAIEKLNLKSIDRKNLKLPYEKAKKILALKKIKSKAVYAELCSKDARFVENPREYHAEKFKNWVDYLSIDKNEYYNLQDCSNKYYEYVEKYHELKSLLLNNDLVIEKLCNYDAKFPPKDFWEDFYGDISMIIKPKRKVSGILA